MRAQCCLPAYVQNQQQQRQRQYGKASSMVGSLGSQVGDGWLGSLTESKKKA
jgi:hypothetical protein